MKIRFEDIQMLELNDERCRRSGTAPFMYNMHLELSSNPALEWQQIFYQERKIPRHHKWRCAWIEHNCIVVDCAPEEVEEYLLNDLKEDVRRSNQKYRAYLEQREEEKNMGEEAEKRERDRLRSLKDRLDFS